MKKHNMAYWILGIVVGSLLPTGIIVSATNWPDWTALPLYFAILGICLLLYFNLTQ